MHIWQRFLHHTHAICGDIWNSSTCGEIFNFPTIDIHGKLKFLHMTNFSPLIILVILVTNIRSGGSLWTPNLYYIIYVTRTFKSFCNLPGKKVAKTFTELFDNPISLKGKFFAMKVNILLSEKYSLMKWSVLPIETKLHKSLALACN